MEKKMIGNRVLVLGCSGSGKSTFAKKLHQLTGLPLTHLDQVWWRADRTHISRDEFDRKLDALFLRYAPGFPLKTGDFSSQPQKPVFPTCETDIDML